MKNKLNKKLVIPVLILLAPLAAHAMEETAVVENQSQEVLSGESKKEYPQSLSLSRMNQTFKIADTEFDFDDKIYRIQAEIEYQKMEDVRVDMYAYFSIGKTDESINETFNSSEFSIQNSMTGLGLTGGAKVSYDIKPGLGITISPYLGGGLSLNAYELDVRLQASEFGTGSYTYRNSTVSLRPMAGLRIAHDSGLMIRFSYERDLYLSQASEEIVYASGSNRQTRTGVDELSDSEIISFGVGLTY